MGSLLSHLEKFGVDDGFVPELLTMFDTVGAGACTAGFTSVGPIPPVMPPPGLIAVVPPPGGPMWMLALQLDVLILLQIPLLIGSIGLATPAMVQAPGGPVTPIFQTLPLIPPTLTDPEKSMGIAAAMLDWAASFVPDTGGGPPSRIIAPFEVQVPGAPSVVELTTAAIGPIVTAALIGLPAFLDEDHERPVNKQEHYDNIMGVVSQALRGETEIPPDVVEPERMRVETAKVAPDNRDPDTECGCD